MPEVYKDRILLLKILIDIVLPILEDKFGVKLRC